MKVKEKGSVFAEKVGLNTGVQHCDINPLILIKQLIC